MGINSGTAYIFKRNYISWSLESKIAPADGELGDRFGNAVAISGHAAIAAAYYDDDNGNTSGSAYLFGFSPDADLNKDCKVDLADFAVFAQWWLYDVTQ